MEAQHTADEAVQEPREVAIRRSNIIQGRNSYRPGQPVPQFEFRQLELHLFIPASTSYGTDDEWTAVRHFADQLLDFKDVGEVIGLGTQSGEFRIVLHLRGPAAMNEDHMLTSTFLRLKSMVEASALFQNGLIAKRPHWKAIKGGDFVADHGEF